MFGQLQRSCTKNQEDFFLKIFGIGYLCLTCIFNFQALFCFSICQLTNGRSSGRKIFTHLAKSQHTHIHIYIYVYT